MHCVSLVMLFLAATVATVSSRDVPRYYDLAKAEQYFEDYIKTYHKVYKNNQDKQVHFEAFKRSLADINKLNKESTTATYGINQFTDYTEDQTKNLFGVKSRRSH